MPRLIKPRAIPEDATFGIAAPGGPVHPDRLEEGCELLRHMGFGVVPRDDIGSRDSYLAGSDERPKEFLPITAGQSVEVRRRRGNLLGARSGQGEG